MPIELIHPMLVHFPIVLAMTAFGCDLVWIASPHRDPLTIPAFKVASVMLVAAGIAAILTAFFGDTAFDVALSRGFSDAQLETHQEMGIATAIVLPALAGVRALVWFRRWEQRLPGALIVVSISALAAVMVAVTAYFGGELVYGLGVNIHRAL
ncbi:DUF2231 domain-containing protein [Paraburkholderia mimosarum]|uniref:DUF2231 domain-containing protein n=1 Tax=Paraburkholderia mimosarum TaxID=312026 RepID=UPI00040A7B29|nr:DUF2231 domain-containing protein [Paraburkholderia mimosarum]